MIFEKVQGKIKPRNPEGPNGHYQFNDIDSATSQLIFVHPMSQDMVTVKYEEVPEEYYEQEIKLQRERYKNTENDRIKEKLKKLKKIKQKVYE